jgi:hypothetical protein
VAGGRLAAALIGAAALVLMLGGCGGAEEGDGTTALKRPTEAGYAKEAQRLCVERRLRLSDELGALAKANGQAGPASKAEVEEAFEQVILPGFRSQFEALRRLSPPHGDEDFLALMLFKFASSLENGEERLARLFRVKLSGYSEFAEGTLMTHEYGIKGCGSLGRSARGIYALLRWT